MDILKLMKNTGDKVAYTPAYRLNQRSFYNYFLKTSTSVTVNVSDYESYIFENDLIGYLDHINIAKEHHYFVMLLNNLTNPSEFNKDIKTLLIPDPSTVNKLKQIYNQRKNII